MKKFVKGENDLASIKPNLIKEWDFEKNEINPYKLIVGSGKKVWWKCDKGHSWEAQVCRRSAGSGCPYCAGQRVIVGENDLATRYPLMAQEWNYEKNGTLLPTDLMGQSGRAVWWKCNFGHEWRVSPNSRISQNTGCPVCSSEYKTSFPEQALLYYLEKDTNVISRFMIDGFEIDIYIPSERIGIEYDGLYYHKDIRSLEREHKKDLFCKENNIELFRIKEYKDKKNDLGVCRNVIWRDITQKDHSLNYVIEVTFEVLKERNIIKGAIDIDVTRDKEKIWSRYIKTKKTNSLEVVYPDIAKEWNYERNMELYPSYVFPGSHKKVWWRCEKGHEWEATISHRVTGSGCPYCSNQKFKEGYNDLKTIYPRITKEWNYEKNEGLKPENVLAGGWKKVWWKCERGHEWEASVRKRIDGNSCPFCRKKRVSLGENDLQTLKPELIEEWDFNKNDIPPECFLPYSNKKVWWVCKKCSYQWASTIGHRSRGRGCPNCAKEKRLIAKNLYDIKSRGSLEAENRILALEWNYEKNSTLKPSMVTVSSNKKVWWRCEKGHEWEAIIANRSKGHGCPYCANRKILFGYNDLYTLAPELEKEWNYEKNIEISPKEVGIGSEKKVWWKCIKCGNEWQSKICDRKKGCPYCSKTNREL